MATIETPNVLIDSSASKLAFGAGQTFQRLVMEAAIEEAERLQASVVTTDHVQSVIERMALDQRLVSIKSFDHGRDTSQRRKSA